MIKPIDIRDISPQKSNLIRIVNSRHNIRLDMHVEPAYNQVTFELSHNGETILFYDLQTAIDCINSIINPK